MAVLWGVLVTAVTLLEVNHPGTAFQAAGASMEGKETRFGEWASALFAVSTTGTSTGAVNSFHDSFTSLGGGALIFNMGLGEVAPGGVGSGLYGMLVLAILTVFVAGLMVGRTPEYLRKKITGREIKLVSLYILTMPLIVLIGTGIAMSFETPRASMLNSRPARAVRGAVRLHLGGEQQRLGLRGPLREHAVLQHRPRLRHAARPVPPDHLRARAGRFAGPAAAGAEDRGHAAHPRSAVRRDAHRRRRSSSPA